MVYLFYFCVSICRLNNNLLADKTYEKVFEGDSPASGNVSINLATYGIAGTNIVSVLLFQSLSNGSFYKSDNWDVVSNSGLTQSQLRVIASDTFKGGKYHAVVRYKTTPLG